MPASLAHLLPVPSRGGGLRSMGRLSLAAAPDGVIITIARVRYGCGMDDVVGSRGRHAAPAATTREGEMEGLGPMTSDRRRSAGGPLASLAVAVALLAACGPGQSGGAKGPDTVRFAMTSNVAGFWPIFIAQSKGLFGQQRIRLDTIVAQTSSRETEALLAGSVDVASGTPDNMLIAMAQGRSVRAVAALRNAPAASLLVRPDIDSFTALKGKRVAVSEITGSDAYFVRTMLQANGADPQAVQLVASGGTPNRAAALQSEAVSA